MSISTELFPPVETLVGEKVRATALWILGERKQELGLRLRRREPTLLERSEMNGLAATIETLHGMAPVGELRAARGSLALGA